LWFLALPFAVGAAENVRVLTFTESGTVVSTVTLETMREQLPVQTLEFFDLQYEKIKRFEAFNLHDVLTLGFGNEWRSPEFTEIVFEALDGYQSLATQATVMHDGGYVTFEDLDRDDGWEPVGRNGADPAPFYVVWTGSDQSTANEYPWPWQLSSIGLVKFRDQYPKVYPQGVEEDSGVFRGFLTFKGRCFRCHAMNQQGGKIGPDLNAPQSIVAYRSENMIREFIRNPSIYRYTHMPDHRDLDDEALDELLAYFWFMSSR
jgi:mono/diheme cytochrome c family protein